jgi:hypothetical protein
MARVGKAILAVILGYLAFLACQETFWQDLARGPVPQRGNLATAVVYGIGRGLLFVHDRLGTSFTVCLLGLAALFFCWQAIRGNNR